VPRSHPFSGRERLQKVVSLGSPKCDRVQAHRAVPPQHEGQEPRAEAAARVVENDPPAFAGRAGRARFLSVVCHVKTGPAEVRASRSPIGGCRPLAAGVGVARTGFPGFFLRAGLRGPDRLVSD
jgi:hypothetical protein